MMDLQSEWFEMTKIHLLLITNQEKPAFIFVLLQYNFSLFVLLKIVSIPAWISLSHSQPPIQFSLILYDK